VDDCIDGVFRVMHSDWTEPLNVGQDRMVTINELVDIVADIAGVPITRRHVPGPVGVRGRNSDNTRVSEVLGWRPRISLEDGLRRTYAWIEGQLLAERRAATARADSAEVAA
jgi:nucleoside-diphosphate-sugar epimerase